ncbi:hypothetical protein [Streptomyces sp. WP-1]|uniref:hypothetical protein n=1 Tax=Streptomyces sp. WP-1 TaxID=3041497 RepID=UPI0026480462|nr:hypothetical protein [Streptomyces sp. WP-1]WKE70457.1 hypothetical protein QHG49_16125 [Streptomyces sp. WP-1]
MNTTYFLLTYDRRRGKLLAIQHFADEAKASAVYAEVEKRYRGNETIEVVLVGADSEQTLRHTHGHYFNSHSTAHGSPSASRFLQALQLV